MEEEDDGVAAAAAPEMSYPKPVSPPYPATSKAVELARAARAAAASDAYTISAGDVVFEDEWMAVVNKPAGIYCETFLSALSDRVASSPPGTRHLHLANRLDRDTSGLMVITKSDVAAGELVRAFAARIVEKEYIALCIGCAPRWRRIRVSSGHGRSRFGAWRVYSASDVGRSLPGGSTVKPMTTSFEVLSVNGEWLPDGGDEPPESIVVAAGGDGDANHNGVDPKGVGVGEEDEILVRARPETGRTHQIRLHCQYLGISIRGDVKYGGVTEWTAVECDTHALHAESLSFLHPISGESIRFRAPPPPAWAGDLRL